MGCMATWEQSACSGVFGQLLYAKNRLLRVQQQPVIVFDVRVLYEYPFWTVPLYFHQIPSAVFSALPISMIFVRGI